MTVYLVCHSKLHTVMAMLATMREGLLTTVNTEHLILRLRNKQGNKLATWEELKIACFTRALASVYGLSFLTVLMHIQLHIVGGFLYIASSTGRVHATLVLLP